MFQIKSKGKHNSGLTNIDLQWTFLTSTHQGWDGCDKFISFVTQKENCSEWLTWWSPDKAWSGLEGPTFYPPLQTPRTGSASLIPVGHWDWISQKDC